MTLPSSGRRSDSDEHSLVVSDLMIGLAAVLMILLALLAPGFGDRIGAVMAATRPGPPEDQVASDLAIARGGPVLLAGPEGATFATPDGQTRLIPLDAIAEEPLPSLGAGVPVLMVRADGREAGFLMETALARAGIAIRDMVWLPDGCTAPRADASGGLICPP